MKSPAMVSVTQEGLEAGFSTHDILQAVLAQLFIKAIHFTVQGKGKGNTRRKNHKDNILPRKVQQVKGQEGRTPWKAQGAQAM